ncbi:hypothetical protein UACE39S_06349 [Ureibacillus acetophenoni]
MNEFDVAVTIFIVTMIARTFAFKVLRYGFF